MTLPMPAMPLDNILALVLATIALAVLPGPNVALTVSRAVRFGFVAGLATVLGVMGGVAVQIAAAAWGLAALVSVYSGALVAVKWAGAAWLLFLGIRALRAGIRAAKAPEAAPARPVPFLRAAAGAMALALANPKTLLFAAAFLPQFVSSPEAAATELPVLAAIHIAVLASVDVGWAALGSFGGARLRLSGATAWVDRISGGAMILAAFGLAAGRATR
ncbi:LysE family translocator [Rhodovulum sp. DZ06]|uniref:LysE family translocator n=1 Tax=Rhodovulum sp. DZ06 TaxID=3425126 RepID=UPI003D333AFB